MKLFVPGKIKNLNIKNRIVMAPMCMYQSTDKGLVMPFHLAHYSSRGYGGVGLIIQEATAVEPRGRITSNDLGIWSDEHINGLSSLVNLVHLSGASIGIQLAHAGRKCMVNGERIISSSNFPFSSTYTVPTEMTTDEIKEVVHAFGEGARRAKLAGYDIIEIHGAHGYLINQFLSPLVNNRRDEYGGASLNRFLFEVITEVKKYWDGPISLRLSVEEYADSGNHIEDTLKLIDSLNHQVDIINVSSGGVVPVSFDVYPLYQIAFAEAIKKKGYQVIGGGLITSSDEVEDILNKGQADFIYLGRALLRDPYFVLHAANTAGRKDLIPKSYERGF